MDKIVFGIDYGERSSGLAKLNTRVGFSEPVGVFHNSELIDFLSKRSDEFDTLVIGLPLNLKGEFSSITFKSIKFAEKVHRILKKRVFLLDERFTSSYGKHLFLQNPSGRKFKAVKDAFAASLILESFFTNPSIAKELNPEFIILPKKMEEKIAGKNVLVTKRYKIGNWVEKAKRLVFLTKDPYYFYLLSKNKLEVLFADLEDISEEFRKEFDIII